MVSPDAPFSNESESWAVSGGADGCHSFASRALALGEGLPIIGRLLGHRRVETIARYPHLARYSVRKSDERIADSLEADIL